MLATDQGNINGDYLKVGDDHIYSWLLIKEILLVHLLFKGG